MKLYSIARSVFLISALGVTAQAACVTDTPYAGCIHFGMRTDSAFYSNYTQNPTQATKDFLTSHFYRMQVSFGFFENNLSWYPNAWAYINSYGLNYGDSIVSTHPEYVMHDVNGNMLYVAFACTGTPTVLGHCARYAGDFTNAGFRSYWIGQHLAILQRGYKGVWMDDVNLDIDTAIPNNNISGTTTPPVDPATGVAMTQAAWQSYFAAFLTQYNATIAAAGFEINENAVWYEGGRPAGFPASTKQAIAATNHWTNVERGVTDGGLTGGSGDFSLRALFTYVDQVHALGRNVELQNYVFSQSGGNNDYVPACYFLISSGLDLMGNDAITPNNWPANYDVDLGTPSGARYNFGNGIRRDFSRGFVIVTPPGTADTIFTLTAGQYTDVAGNPLTSIDIPASQGLIALTTTAPPSPTTLSMSPSSGWTFGSTNVGTTSGSATISTTNSGTSNATFSSVTIGGSNPGDFAIVSNTCTGSLAPAASCNVSFTFTPTASGARSASLIFADSAASSPQSVPLSGTGVTITNSVSFSSPSWTFGSHPIGQTSGNGNITATNNGSNSFSFTSVAFTGTNPGDFSIVGNACTGSLAPAASCLVTFNFTPTGTGSRTANLTFTDGATGSPQTVAIAGTGAPSSPSTLSFSNTTWAFGSYTVSTASSSATITTTNSGSSVVNFTSVALTGTNPGDFSISSNTCTGALAVNASCSTVVTFTPSATGSRGASLTYTDDATASPQAVFLTGTGIAAPPVTGLSFSNPSWTFGSIPVGQNVPSGTIVMTNVGSGSITLTSQVFTGTNPGDFPITSNTCGATLAAGANCSVTFNFAPSDVGTRSANLVWTSSDPLSPQSTSVSGTGIAANSFLNFSNASWDFSSLLVGTTSPTATITATNGGNVPLTFSSTTITGLNPGDFAISANTCLRTLTAGSSCTFSFSFTPLATGARSANVEFADDASPTPGPQDVPIVGTGTAPIANASVSFSFASWSFGSHRIGTTSGSGHTTVTNTGNTILTFSSIAFTGTNASDFAITANTCGSTLAVGANCTVTFNTTPSAVGLRTSFLTFTDTATGSPQLVTVSGPGTAPAPSIQFSGNIVSKGRVSAH